VCLTRPAPAVADAGLDDAGLDDTGLDDAAGAALVALNWIARLSVFA
jgi:hypothetical protein